MSDNQLNPDVVASSPAENLVPAQEATPEPNEEFTLTTEQLETSLSELEERQISQTECPDSEGLGASPAGQFLIGCVDEVNGKSAEEVPRLYQRSKS